MLSALSTDDFEDVPTKGTFRQLQTITNAVLVVAAGMT